MNGRGGPRPVVTPNPTTTTHVDGGVSPGVSLSRNNNNIINRGGMLPRGGGRGFRGGRGGDRGVDRGRGIPRGGFRGGRGRGSLAVAS